MSTIIKKTSPLFSIGITTYNRKVLLKTNILNFLKQTFIDFEIIIGNDFTGEIITAETLEIYDSRIRFINHEKNLGELENMNYLLKISKGKYFTWLFDDDGCSPEWLSDINSVIEKNKDISCIFTSYNYEYGDNVPKYNNESLIIDFFSGKDFVSKYLSGSLKVMGCSGFFESNYLKNLGGVQKLTNGHMALYSEYLLIIRTSQLAEVAYINKSLVSFRVHENSFSKSNIETELFKEAGLNLIGESIQIFANSYLDEDFEKNITSILKSIVSHVIIKMHFQYKIIPVVKIAEYRLSIEKKFNILKKSQGHLYDKSIRCVKVAFDGVPRYILKARLKHIIPTNILKLVHKLNFIISKYTKKPF
jgi:glycosyltransferase involved in cell wall biosynthesis